MCIRHFLPAQKGNDRHMIMYPLISALIIIADQITKYMVRSGMQPGDSIPVIGEWLRIYYVRNTGTAFSMFSGNKMITIVLTSVLIIGCLVYAVKEARSGSKITALFLTMIASGGLSNLIDRLTLGYVTDMISCSSFAVFNVADIAVTCGCFLLVIYLLLTMRSEDEEK
ncbi:MAG: signal peptidase II [Clostridiales bacterium]|nr:signal peptidase II [Clostridiales bacterium]